MLNILQIVFRSTTYTLQLIRKHNIPPPMDPKGNSGQTDRPQWGWGDNLTTGLCQISCFS